MVGFDVALEAFHKAGYLLKDFFHENLPLTRSLSPQGKRMLRVEIEPIIVFWTNGVKEEIVEELDFGLAEGFLNFNCLLGKEFPHLICLKKPFQSAIQRPCPVFNNLLPAYSISKPRIPC